MPFTDETHNGQYAKKHIGQGLIDFSELDLSEYRLLLDTTKGYSAYDGALPRNQGCRL